MAHKAVTLQNNALRDGIGGTQVPPFFFQCGIDHPVPVVQEHDVIIIVLLAQVLRVTNTAWCTTIP